MNERTEPSRGNLLFALLFVILALFLVSQLGEQAKFSSKGKLFAQPAFWPGVGVIGMAVFGCLNLLAALFAVRRGNRHHVEDQNPCALDTQRDTTSQKDTVPQGSTAQQGDTTRQSVAAVVRGELKEAAGWLLALEYLAWFMAYVYITPIVGYLSATLVFLLLLTLRIGYRNRRMMIAAVVVALAIVLVFKSFLGVKIPGGAVYEYLPDALRSFMIINF